MFTAYRSWPHTVRTPLKLLSGCSFTVKISCAEKAHVLENKALFDDAVTGARSGSALKTRVLMSDPDKTIVCLGTPDESLSL